MAQMPMYLGMVNSPQTELATAIDDTQTTIDVQNGDSLPDAPNLAVIIGGELSETILYTEKTGNVLSGITRGFQGEARGWSLGTKIVRNGTEYDHRAFKENIEDLQEQIEGITPLSIGAETPLGAQSKADAAQTAAEESAQILVNDLQTDVNQLGSDLTTHTATQIYQNEAHGMRVTDGVLEWFNGTEWVAVKSGQEAIVTNTTFYVNSTTGSDANDGKTSGSAWKTLQHACDVLTKYTIMASSVTINLTGEFPEDVVFYCPSGGGTIRPFSPSKSIVRSVKIFGSGCRVAINNLSFSLADATSATASISAENGSVVDVTNCDLTGTFNYGVRANYGSSVFISNCTISNKSSSAISSVNNSRIYSSSVTGSSNAVGLEAVNNSSIGKNGTQPSGTTAQTTSGGSVIR
jgi:hypothetical protein